MYLGAEHFIGFLTVVPSAQWYSYLGGEGRGREGRGGSGGEGVEERGGGMSGGRGGEGRWGE